MNNGDFSAAFMLVTVLSASFFLGSFFLPETAKQAKPLLNEKEPSCEA